MSDFCSKRDECASVAAVRLGPGYAHLAHVGESDAVALLASVAEVVVLVQEAGVVRHHGAVGTGKRGKEGINIIEHCDKIVSIIVQVQRLCLGKAETSVAYL